MRRSRRLPTEALAPYLVAVPDPPAPLDGRTLFGNSNPVEIEVGFGKGLFLLTASQTRPEVNFLGVEIERKYCLYTANRIAKRGLGNVKLAHADARLFFRGCLPARCVRAVHVFFPDPWWKKRHHKRRLFTAEFVAECARVLEQGGRLNFVTDVEEYFYRVSELVAVQPSLGPLPPPEPGTPAHDLDYLTNFERKFRKEGRPIYRAAWRCAGDAPLGAFGALCRRDV